MTALSPQPRDVITSPRRGPSPRARGRGRRLQWRWLLAFVPFALLFAVALVAPLYILFEYAVGNSTSWSGVFHSPVQVDGLVRTLAISLETTAICIVVGYAYAGAVVGARPRLRALLLGIAVLPFLVSTLVRSYGWIVVLGPNGPLNGMLGWFGLHAGFLYNRLGVMIGMVSIMLPFFILPLYAVWSQVPDNLRRAARTLGANRVDAFLRVDLPLTLPGAAAGTLLVFITSMGFFITPSLLGGEHDRMVSQLIDEQLTRLVDLNGAAVLAVLLLAAVVLLLVLFRFFYPIELLFVQDARTLEESAATRGSGRVRRALPRRPGGGRALLAVTRVADVLPWHRICQLLAGATAVFFVIPLLIVIPISLTGESYLHFPPSSLSLRWFHQVLGDPTWREAALHSLIAGVLAVSIALAVGLPAAFALVRSRMSSRVKGLVMLLATLPVMLPPIVLALAMYAWYLQEHLLDSLPALALAQALLGLPFVIVIVMSALRDFDERLERAARSLGARWRTTLRLVTLPLLKRAIWAGVLFAFLQSFDELLIARAVTGVGTQTLPVVMWNGANEQISPALGAVSVLFMLVTLAALGALALIRRTNEVR